MLNYKLGKVAFVDQGMYSPSTVYNKWDFVTTSDSTYLYINDTPMAGKEVMDISYWKCLADGKSATTAAANANIVATNVANAEAQRVANGAEVKINKQNSLAIDGTGIKYPTVDAVNNSLTPINTELNIAQTNIQAQLGLTTTNYPSIPNYVSNPGLLWFNNNCIATTNSILTGIQGVFNAAATYNIYVLSADKLTLRIAGTITTTASGYSNIAVNIPIYAGEMVTTDGSKFRGTPGVNNVVKIGFSGNNVTSVTTDVLEFGLSLTFQRGNVEIIQDNVKNINNSLTQINTELNIAQTNIQTQLALSTTNYPSIPNYVSNPGLLWFNNNCIATTNSILTGIQSVFNAAATYNIYILSADKSKLRIAGTITTTASGYSNIAVNIPIAAGEMVTTDGSKFRVTTGVNNAVKIGFNGTNVTSVTTDILEFGLNLTFQRGNVEIIQDSVKNISNSLISINTELNIVQTNIQTQLGLSTTNYSSFPNYVSYPNLLWFNNNCIATTDSILTGIQGIFNAAATYNIYALSADKLKLRIAGTITTTASGYSNIAVNIPIYAGEMVTTNGSKYRVTTGVNNAVKIGFSGNNVTSVTTDILEFGLNLTFQNSAVEYIQSQVNKINKVIAPISDITPLSMPRYRIATPNFIDFANYYFFGRWQKININSVAHMCTINQGSEIFVKVSNTTSVQGLFTDISSSGNTPYVSVSIDGGAFKRILIASSVTLATGLSLDEHYIRIIVSGLQEHDDKWIGFIGLAFKGLQVDTGGVMVPIYPDNRYALFLGDSITEGINMLGTGANPTVNCAETEYSFVSCQKTNSVGIRVGFGATGVTTGGSGGVPKCLIYIDYMQNGVKEFAQYPDYIVINHGSNDSGATDALFTTEYTAVLNRLQIKYPGIPVFAMRPFNGSKGQIISSICASFANVFFVDTTGWAITTSDGSHPDVAGGIVAGTNLATFIKNTLGVQYFVK